VSDRASGRFPYRLLAVVFFLPVCLISIPCLSKSREVVCNNGVGKFEAEFYTGVKVRVAASKKSEGGLANRACEATLSWDKQGTMVATEASQLDVDVFGADLGLGIPVVAFQIKKSDTECCMAYQIYSLQKPVRLLRTITGGNFFSASDKDLDGRVEMWTSDTGAVDGFEGLVLGELDFAPTIVLRFDRNRLLDVSSEFRPYFDQQIARLRTGLDPQDLSDFKNSDGKLMSAASLTAERFHQLRGVKIKVLEIVWSYLYSDRELEAWGSLADMWPASDVKRVQTAILNMRSHGISAQVDGIPSKALAGHKKRAIVFDTTKATQQGTAEVIPPQSILLQRPVLAAADQGVTNSEMLLDLLIDCAGKVHSVESAGNTKVPDPDLIKAAMDWTFVPALKDGHAVASRLRLAVSAKR